MEYLLNTGNLVSNSTLDLSQATGFTVVAEKLNFFRLVMMHDSRKMLSLLLPNCMHMVGRPLHGSAVLSHAVFAPHFHIRFLCSVKANTAVPNFRPDTCRIIGNSQA